MQFHRCARACFGFRLGLPTFAPSHSLERMAYVSVARLSTPAPVRKTNVPTPPCLLLASEGAFVRPLFEAEMLVDAAPPPVLVAVSSVAIASVWLASIRLTVLVIL